MSISNSEKKRLAELPDKLTDYQAPEAERPEKKKLPNEKARQILVNNLIEEAIERGEFDDLPGKGKPLVFDDNPYLAPGQDLAFGLLKNNGFAPDWIERDKEIRRLRDKARQQLAQAWQQHQDNPAYEAQWQQAVARFETTLINLNRKIDDFNLIVPSRSLHRARLRLTDEIQRAKT